MPAATPSFPSPPTPTGHCTDLSAPTFVDQSELSLESHEVKTFVVPDSSERCTIWMAVEGRLTPGFKAAIAGSFHVLIVPRKILAAVVPSSFKPVWRPCTL